MEGWTSKLIKPLTNLSLLRGNQNRTETRVLLKVTPYVSGVHMSKWDKGLNLAFIWALGILFLLSLMHIQTHGSNTI